MPRTRQPYSAEFRRRLVELVRGGQTPEDLARKFEPSANAIPNWVVQAARDEGHRTDGLTTDEKEEERRLPPAPGGAGAAGRAGDLAKSRGLVRQGDHVDPITGFEFVKGYQADHAIATMCRVLGVSPSGHYAWQHRPLSARAQGDAELTMTIRTIHLESRGTYGAPRVHAERAAQGIRVGRKRVARLMRAACLQGVSRRKWVTTTTRDPEARPAADLVQRDFRADGPDRLWVADITYLPTDAGFLYPPNRAPPPVSSLVVEHEPLVFISTEWAPQQFTVHQTGATPALLFGDLKGSMELLADRDPEEARKILDPVLERMMEAVHRYEGHREQGHGRRDHGPLRRAAGA